LADPARRAREALGNRLQDLRKTAGLTGTALAARLGTGWDQPKVSRIERGKQLPTPDEIVAWASETGANPEELITMRDRAAAEYDTFRSRYTAAGASGFQDAIGAAEARATRVAEYQSIVIPGILQTPDYARDLLHLEGGPATYGTSEDEISHMIAARQRRQAILFEPGRQIIQLLGEGALRTRFASPAAMRGQCEQIARFAESLTTAVIGVIPFTAPVPVLPAMTGWRLRDDLAIVESAGGELDIADPVEVQRYWKYTQMLLDVAVTGQRAAGLCRAVAGEMN